MTTGTEAPAPGQAARQPPQVRPGAGSARWLKPLVLPLGLGRLEITDAGGRAEAYDVGAHLDAGGRVVGFRLVNDDDEGHDLYPDSGRWACSCPHCGPPGGAGVGGCAHAAGLRAALAALPAAALAQIALWAAAFVGCGELADFEGAFDHSAVNVTTRG
jgi:hypothetical protein